MGQITLQIPQTNQPDSTEDPKIASGLSTIQTLVNGNIDVTNLATSPGIARYQQGLAAARPAAGTVVPGTVYKATDTGAVSLGDGASWFTVMVAGAWTAITSLGAGISSAVGLGYYAPQARTIGDRVELKGAIQSSGALGVNATLLTLPSSAMFPSSTVGVPVTYNGSGATITTAGVLKNSTSTSGSGVFWLDGVSFSVS